MITRNPRILALLLGSAAALLTLGCGSGSDSILPGYTRESKPWTRSVPAPPKLRQQQQTSPVRNVSGSGSKTVQRRLPKPRANRTPSAAASQTVR